MVFSSRPSFGRRLAAGALGIACLCVAAPVRAEGAVARLTALDEDQQALRAHQDIRQMRGYVRGVNALAAEIASEKALWSHDPDHALSPQERRKAFEIFERVLAYEVAFDSIAKFHAEFWKIPLVTKPLEHSRHFVVGSAAYLQLLDLGFLFISKTIGKPQFEKLLDEGNQRFGIPAGAYARLKWNVVHVLDVTRIVSLVQYHRLLQTTGYKKFKRVADVERRKQLNLAVSMIDAAYPSVEKSLKERGVEFFAGNGLDILKDTGHRAWFPVQAGVAEWMGDTKVHRIHDALIKEAQIESAIARTRPGDVVIERRNWYLSNVGLPGFWPHAALWLGSPSELAAFLDADDEVQKHYKGAFTAMLRRKFPRPWATYSSTDTYDHPHRVMEAMSEGVLFTTAEHSLAADYAAAIRPRISRLEVAKAIEKAFEYYGRPYDFDFDFYTDTSIVCSELVYKAYEPRAQAKGVSFPLEKIMGRMTLPPNTMVRQFDEQFGRDEQQTDFVWFLDGHETTGSAVWSDLNAFRDSWRRPKWDIAQR